MVCKLLNNVRKKITELFCYIYNVTFCSMFTAFIHCYLCKQVVQDPTNVTTMQSTTSQGVEINRTEHPCSQSDIQLSDHKSELHVLQ